MSSMLAAILGLMAAATPLTVCSSGCDYTLPQKAVEAAQPGTIVIIKSGKYKSDVPLSITKSISLLGEDWPVIEGNGRSDVVQVLAANVRIDGLEIGDSGSSFLHELAAIRVEGVTGCEITNNRLRHNAYGIYLANSEKCRVSRNELEGSYASEAEAGNGIHSWQGKSHTIEDNVIRAHRDGIYLEFTNESEIKGNLVQGNLRYGLHFMSSHRNQYRENRFSENGAGVAVMYSRNVDMVHNVFADNRGAAAYGLLLKDISLGTIRDNLFDDNTYGIYMEGTNRATFERNNFTHNGVALRILGDCDDNTFRYNNFSANTFAVTTNSSRNPNRFEENYWSQYDGYDLEGDGIGDVPFRPVSLSSVIVERYDSTYVLIKSPLFLILDQIEQVFPMLIPESLVDTKPRMSQFK